MQNHLPKLFLHIGLPKTATTYLQAVAEANRDTLRSSKMLYPHDPRDSSLINHHSFYEAVETMDTKALENFLISCLSTAESTDCNKILISHENLCTLAKPRDSTELLKSICIKLGVELHPVVTTRNAPDLFRALLVQEMATKGSAVFTDRIGRFDAPTIFEMLLDNVAKWSGTFEACTIIPLRSLDGEPIDNRFFQAIGCHCSLPEKVSPQNERSSKSVLGQSILGLLRCAHEAINDDSGFDYKAEAAGERCYHIIANILNKADDTSAQLMSIEEELNSLLSTMAAICENETLQRVNKRDYDTLFACPATRCFK